MRHRDCSVYRFFHRAECVAALPRRGRPPCHGDPPVCLDPSVPVHIVQRRCGLDRGDGLVGAGQRFGIRTTRSGAPTAAWSRHGRQLATYFLFSLFRDTRSDGSQQVVREMYVWLLVAKVTSTICLLSRAVMCVCAWYGSTAAYLIQDVTAEAVFAHGA